MIFQRTILAATAAGPGGVVRIDSGTVAARVTEGQPPPLLLSWSCQNFMNSRILIASPTKAEKRS